MSKEQSVFDRLSKIDVGGKTEKKGKFTYLSWAWAWAELKKVSPSATTKVYHDENTNMPYFASQAGVIVKVGVTVDDLEHISYLPVMDFKNNSVPAEKVDMMAINKAIQRATVKAIGLHGLGLYIYAGEDLPMEDDNNNNQEGLVRKESVVKKSGIPNGKTRKPQSKAVPDVRKQTANVASKAQQGVAKKAKIEIPSVDSDGFKRAKMAIIEGVRTLDYVLENSSFKDEALKKEFLRQVGQNHE